MSEGETVEFGEKLVYEDRVPLRWEARAGEAPPADQFKAYEANEETLRCFAALDEYHGEASDEEHGHGTHELARVEFKVDLLLDMVARLLTHHVRIPDPAPIRMGAAGLQWETPDPPSPGQYVSVELYLNRKYPRPILLFGEVTEVASIPGGFQVDMSYRDMSEAVRNWIEKLIFRQHRRRIAYTRRARDDSL